MSHLELYRIKLNQPIIRIGSIEFEPSKMSVSVVFVLSLLLCAFAQQQVFPVWPYPHTVVSNNQNYNIWNWKSFEFISELKHPNIFAKEILDEALKRYKSLTFSEEAESRDCPDCVKGLRVVVLGKDENIPSLEMNEEYMLEIDTKKQYFTLQSESVWGALRGLETFSQLVEIDKNYYIANTSMMIKDKPRFKWRGLMIDTARHFIDVNTILKMIDAMAYSKFNVLHWHMVDAESFPVQIPKYPLLAEKGAYHPSAMYSIEDVKKVMVYATYRGIRVVPEIDVPGHSYSWGKGYPLATAKCPRYEHNINNIPLSPAQNISFDLLDGVLGHLATILADKYVHLGSDEVVIGCWKADPEITKFMQARNWTDYETLFAYFEQRLESIYRKYNRRALFWQELLFKHTQFQIPKDAIIQVWMKPTDLATVVKQGYQGILSAGWYLDKQKPHSNAPDRGLWVDTWKDFYELEPYNTGSYSSSEQKLILGGEACIWGEHADPLSLQERVWPRACATAERLWSERSVNNTAAAQARLVKFRCNTLVRRGIRATPIRPDFCPYVKRLV